MYSSPWQWGGTGQAQAPRGGERIGGDVYHITPLTAYCWCALCRTRAFLCIASGSKGKKIAQPRVDFLFVMRQLA